MRDPDGGDGEGQDLRSVWAMLAGIFLLVLSYFMYWDESVRIDPRQGAGVAAGTVTVVLVWGHGIAFGGLRWWKTALAGAFVAVVASAAAHLWLGGSSQVLPRAAIELGGGAALGVGLVEAGGLHLLSFGGGWGQASAGSQTQVDPVGNGR